jgi:hypothetical protein
MGKNKILKHFLIGNLKNSISLLKLISFTQTNKQIEIH